MPRNNTIIYLAFFLLMQSCFNKQNNHEENSVSDAIRQAIHPMSHQLNENSGIIYWNDLIWSFNDSGGENKLYASSLTDTLIKQIITIANATNYDWEDIAQDELFIYIADTGNNLGNRKNLRIYKVPKSQIQDTTTQVLAEIIRFSYADQKDFQIKNRANKFDCESLLTYKNDLLIFSKDWVNAYTRVFKLPKQPGTYFVNAIDSFNVQGLATGADLSKKGKLALTAYNWNDVYIWTFDMEENKIFSNPQRFDLTSIDGAQTEGVCFKNKNTLFISCENNDSFKQQLWEVNLKKLSAN